MHWKGVRPENFGSVRTVLTSLLRRGPDFVSGDHGNGLQKLDLRDIKEKESKELNDQVPGEDEIKVIPYFCLG